MIVGMSDDFGTVNFSRGERARQIEVARQQYLRHRAALESMIADAPGEHLVSEYRRLIAEIDASLSRLDDLAGGPPAPDAPSPYAYDSPHAGSQTERDPAFRPLVTTELPDSGLEPPSRLPLILVVAVVALAGIGWLIWRASSAHPTDGAVVEDTAAATSAPVPTATHVVEVAALLTVSPPSQDYGVIRKGTRVTRQFEIANHTDQPVTIDLARSACRCLYYEYSPRIAPEGKAAVTVTVDGARAAAGELRETIPVSTKPNPAAGTNLHVIATIR
jgi:hypothetical protein